MEAVRIPVVVGADRRLILDLPPSTPIGPADVLIVPHADRAEIVANPARDAARAKLLAAGFLMTEIHAHKGARALSEEELARIGRLPEGARPSEDLIDEDRGTYRSAEILDEPISFVTSDRNLRSAASAEGMPTEDPLTIMEDEGADVP